MCWPTSWRAVPAHQANPGVRHLPVRRCGGVRHRARDPFAFRGAIERLVRAQGVCTIAAAPAGAEAQEVDELRHGVLTYALLAGLGGVRLWSAEGSSSPTQGPRARRRHPGMVLLRGGSRPRADEAVLSSGARGGLSSRRPNSSPAGETEMSGFVSEADRPLTIQARADDGSHE